MLQLTWWRRECMTVANVCQQCKSFLPESCRALCLQANQAAMGEASRELDLISSDAQGEDQGSDNWVQVFKAAVEKKVGTGGVQDKVSSPALLMQVLERCNFVCCS